MPGPVLETDGHTQRDTMDHNCFVNIGQNLFEESNGSDSVSFVHSKIPHDNCPNKKIPSIRRIFYYAFWISMVSYFGSKLDIFTITVTLPPDIQQTNLSSEVPFPDSLLRCNGIDYYFIRDMHHCKEVQFEPTLIEAGGKPKPALEGARKGLMLAAFITVIFLSLFLWKENKSSESSKRKLPERKSSPNLSSPSPTKRVFREAASLEKENIFMARYSSEVPSKGGFKEVKRCSRILPQSPDSCPHATGKSLLAKSYGEMNGDVQK